MCVIYDAQQGSSISAPSAIPISITSFTSIPIGVYQLFYQIPKDGDSNSHNAILQKEADYLGINLNTETIKLLLEYGTSPDTLTNLMRDDVLENIFGHNLNEFGIIFYN